MAWNGAGSFSRTNGFNTGTTVWQQDAAGAVDIEADRHDNHDQDLADGINACLAKNGENAMVGNLNMGGNDIADAGAIAADSLSIGATGLSSSGGAGLVGYSSTTVLAALDDLYSIEDRGSSSGNGSIELDFASASIQRITLTGAAILSFINPTSGRAYLIELLQDATGSHTVTWPGTVKWPGGTAPTLTTTANRKDVFTLVWNGTNYLAQTFGLDYSDTV